VSAARFIALGLKFFRETVEQLEQVIWLLFPLSPLLKQQVIYLHHLCYNKVLELTVLSLGTDQLLKTLVQLF
jgi:hypothetical protein